MTTKVKREQCPAKYQGPSYPELHGIRCGVNHHPHQGRHVAVRSDKRTGDNHRLTWYDRETTETP